MFNLAVYDNVKIEKSTPEVVKSLQISRSVDLWDLDEDFGKVLFWDDIEKILSSTERTFYDDIPGHDEL